MRLFCLLAVTVLWGCNGADDTEDLCVHDPPLNYTNWGRGFLSKHCTGCHSSIVPEDHRNEAPTGVHLDTLDDVHQYASRIEARVLLDLEDPMPPGGGPTAEELELLQEWLTCSVFPDVEAQ